MFEIKNNLKFVTIDQTYLERLYNVDHEVYYQPQNYGNKPYLGVLVNADNRLYVIPLTSAKHKHLRWNNIGRDYYLIYEVISSSIVASNGICLDIPNTDRVKHILSVLDIKKMIPVKDGVYNEINFNINYIDNDYLLLLQKEFNFCRARIDGIVAKANKIYNEQMSSGNVRRFHCNFRLLEEVCDNY